MWGENTREQVRDRLPTEAAQPLVVGTRRRRRTVFYIPPLAGQAYQTAGPARHILFFTTIITIIYFKTAPKLRFL